MLLVCMSLAATLNKDCLAPLARLAAHFGHAKIDTIKDVAVTEVSETAVSLEVLSCDANACVSIHLPIEFPRACVDVDDFGACVLDNIRDLDANLPPDSSPVVDSSAAKFVTYHNRPDPPTWWRDAGPDLKAACNDAKDILNTGFVDDLRKLASTLRNGAFVRHVRGDALGPAGVLLDADGRGLHVPFHNVCHDAAALHSALIAIVPPSS